MDLARLTSADLPVDLGYLHLISVLGEGSCGRSFRAESRGVGGLPRSVAVTVLPPGLLEDQLRWRELQTEVSRAALLRHRGVVRTFSLTVEGGAPYLISELVEGATLKQLMAQGGPLTARQGLDVGIQLISALAAAHEPRPGSGDIPLPHGELRPSAVMLGVDGVVKLRGFGLGKVQPSNPGSSAASFASPEALSGQRLSLGTDLFSLGGLLVFLLTGDPPFPVHRGASAGERIAAVVRGLRGGGVLSDVDQIVPGLGSALGRMLCLDPTLRFATAGEAEAIFREVRGGLPRSSRLKEVITERFGDQLRQTGDFQAADSVSRYLTADPPTPVLKPPPAPRPGMPPSDTLSRVPAPDSLEVEVSRDLGAPDPPPIPVPNREILAAPRGGPILVDPGPVGVPAPEAFRPISGATEDPGVDSGSGDEESESAEAAQNSGEASPGLSLAPTVEPVLAPTPPPALTSKREPAFELVQDISLDLDDETTDADVPLGALPDSLGRMPQGTPAPAAVLSPASERAADEPSPLSHRGDRSVSVETAEAVSPIGDADAQETSPSIAAPQRSSEATGKRAFPVRRFALVVGLLAVFALVLVMVVNLRGGLETGMGAGSVAAVDKNDASSSIAPEAEVLSDGTLASDGSGGGERAAVESGDGSAGFQDGTDENMTGGQEELQGAESEGASTVLDEERQRRRREAREQRRSRELTEASAVPERESGAPVSLSLSHSPLRSARVGSSELVTARMDAPRSSKVVLHSGPAGGPYKKSRLKAKSGGRWEGWIDFRGVSAGENFHYWLVATHPRASSAAQSGSRSAPHQVALQ